MLLLGGHSQVASPELKAAILRIKPRLWKTMNHDYTFWSDIKTHLPDMKLIGRLFDSWSTHKMADPVEAGRSWADRQFAVPAFRDLYAYVEFLNEIFGYTNPDRWAWMDIAQDAYIDRWKELDPTKIVIVGNCGSGNLRGNDWVTYFPRTVAKARLFGFHGYGFPTISTDAADQFLRYREIMAKIREVNPDALGVITEMGITHMVIPGNPDRGYLDFMSPEEFWAGSGNLRWANDRLIEDRKYMLGGVVFQIGGSSIPPPQPDGWASFECLGTSIIDEMAAISPGTPAIIIEEEPTTMGLAEQFPEVFEAWTAAGGDPEESFRTYLQATGRLAVTPADYQQLGERIKAHVSELTAIGLALPKA